MMIIGEFQLTKLVMNMDLNCAYTKINLFLSLMIKNNHHGDAIKLK